GAPAGRAHGGRACALARHRRIRGGGAGRGRRLLLTRARRAFRRAIGLPVRCRVHRHRVRLVDARQSGYVPHPEAFRWIWIDVNSSSAPVRRRMRRSYRRRGTACFDYRIDAAKLARRRNRPLLGPENNGEEDQFPDRRWNYSKGLQHDGLGHVDPASYDALLHAVTTGAPADFDAIPLAGVRKLVSPQAGLGFDLEGPDSF